MPAQTESGARARRRLAGLLGRQVNGFALELPRQGLGGHAPHWPWETRDDRAVAKAADPAHPLDGVSLLPVFTGETEAFPRALHWRMNHKGQRALRDGRWKYLRVSGVDYLFDLDRDERERANQARREPARLEAMRQAWEAWEATMPPIPPDATVTLGYSVQDMPPR